jgi:hypothetical protein
VERTTSRRGAGAHGSGSNLETNGGVVKLKLQKTST